MDKAEDVGKASLSEGKNNRVPSRMAQSSDTFFGIDRHVDHHADWTRSVTGYSQVAVGKTLLIHQNWDPMLVLFLVWHFRCLQVLTVK